MKKNKLFSLNARFVPENIRKATAYLIRGNRASVISLLILFFSIGAGLLSAAEPSLRSAAVPEKSSVGQPLTYTLTISGINPDSLKITLPEKKVVYPEEKIEKESEKKTEKKDKGESEKSSDEFVPLYIINSASRDDSEAGGNKLIDIKIMISYYRPGSYTLPEIKIAGSDGVAIGYKIPVVTIEEINKEGKLEDIEPPVFLSGNYKRIIWIVAAVILFAAAVFLLVKYIRNRRKPLIAQEPVLPPIEVFLNDVESLKLRELIQEGKINEYVFGISIVFRRYLSLMLMFDAAEMTTDEISIKIKKFMPRDLYAICGEEIVGNMRLWDFSKFAEFAPSSELLLENLDATISVAKRISGMERGDDGTVRI